jgi:hypothetical protein
MGTIPEFLGKLDPLKTAMRGVPGALAVLALPAGAYDIRDRVWGLTVALLRYHQIAHSAEPALVFARPYGGRTLLASLVAEQLNTSRRQVVPIGFAVRGGDDRLYRVAKDAQRLEAAFQFAFRLDHVACGNRVG